MNWHETTNTLWHAPARIHLLNIPQPPQTAPWVGKQACRSLSQWVKILSCSFPLFSRFLSSFSLSPFHFSFPHCPSSLFPFQEGNTCHELDGIDLDVELSVYRIIKKSSPDKIVALCQYVHQKTVAWNSVCMSMFCLVLPKWQGSQQSLVFLSSKTLFIYS